MAAQPPSLWRHRASTPWLPDQPQSPHQERWPVHASDAGWPVGQNRAVLNKPGNRPLNWQTLRASLCLHPRTIRHRSRSSRSVRLPATPGPQGRALPQTNCEEHHCRERSGTPGLPRRAPRRSSQQQAGKLTFSEDLPRARHVLGARMPGRPQDRGTLKKMPPLLQQKQTRAGIDHFRVRLGERSGCSYIEFVFFSTMNAILLLPLRLPPPRPPAGFLLARGIQFGQPWDGQADLRPSAG